MAAPATFGSSENISLELVESLEYTEVHEPQCEKQKL